MDHGPSLDHHRMQPSLLGVMPPGAAHKRPAACDDAADAGAASCAEVDSPDEVGLPAARRQKTGKGKGRKGGITDIADDRLSTFIHFCFERLSSDEHARLSQNMKALSGKLVVGSACSGSEIARGVFDILACKLNVQVCTAFTCEKEPWKREWIQGVVEPALGERGNPCCFGDIENLNRPTAYCCTHLKQCLIKHCNVFSSGFSCRTMSKINSAREEANTCLASGTGTSGTTFRGLASYLQAHRPPVLVLENVAEVTDGTNYDTLMGTLTGLHYDASVVILKGSDYVSPQRRVRAYVLAFFIGDSTDTLNSPMAVRLVKRLSERSGDLVQGFTLGENHVYVRKELARRLKLRAKRSEAEAAQETKETSTWKEKCAETLARQHMTWSSCMAPDAAAGQWAGTLTERQRLALGYALSQEPHLCFADLGQSLGRAFTSTTPNECPTIIPNCTVWSTQLQRPLLGSELLLIQGMAPKVMRFALRQATNMDSHYSDLAGNAFTGFVFAAAAISALTYAPLQPGSTEGVARSVSSVLGL